MNKNQEITFQLLKEIDEICKNNNIKYYLHTDTVVMALCGGEYIDNYLSTAIEMTTQDAKKFIQYVNDNPKENRVLEHMGNYEGYAGFNMKYVNTDTTYIPVNYYDNYKNKGIGIHIFFIRKLNTNKWVQKCWTALEYGLEQNEFFYNRKPGKREAIGKIVVKLMQLFWNKASMKKYLFNKWLNGYEYVEGEKAVVRKSFGKSHTYPAKYLSKDRYVEFEGYSFPVFNKVEDYVSLWRGQNWKKNIKGVKPGKELLVDGSVGYRKYIDFLEKEGVYLENIKLSHKNVKKQLIRRSKLNKEKNKYWEFAWNVCHNYIADKRYDRSMNYISALHRNKAYMELSNKLSYYDTVMRENIKYDYSRTGREEIHSIYKEILKYKGENSFLDKIAVLEK